MDNKLKICVCAGIDEAGRGALLGDLIIAMVSCTPEQEQKLKEAGVKDSKRLSPIRREELAGLIRTTSEQIEVLNISSVEIDLAKHDGKNLNKLELEGFQTLFSRCKNPFIYKIIRR